MAKHKQRAPGVSYDKHGRRRDLETRTPQQKAALNEMLGHLSQRVGRMPRSLAILYPKHIRRTLVGSVRPKPQPTKENDNG